MTSLVQIAGHYVTCKTCGKTQLVLDGQNVHDGLDCPCCPSSTHTHAGPDQSTVNEVCRNVIVSLNAVLAPVVGDVDG